MELITPSSPGALPTLSLTTNALGYFGQRGWQAYHQPSGVITSILKPVQYHFNILLAWVLPPRQSTCHIEVYSE